MHSNTIVLPPWQRLVPEINPDDTQCRYAVWKWFGDFGCFIGHVGTSRYNVTAMTEPGRTPFERLYFVPAHDDIENPILAVRLRRDWRDKMGDPNGIFRLDSSDPHFQGLKDPLMFYEVWCGYTEDEPEFEKTYAIHGHVYRRGGRAPSMESFVAEKEFLEEYTTNGLRAWVHLDDDTPTKKRKAEADVTEGEEPEPKRAKIETTS